MSNNHAVAGRHIWGRPDSHDGESCVMWCECGLSFFGPSREAADKKWRDHAGEAALDPGWRPDPYGSGQLRYWDGRKWTGNTKWNSGRVDANGTPETITEWNPNWRQPRASPNRSL
jgi:hypothetical protein